MILTAHQPLYLPWLGLFDKIKRADLFVVFDCVPFSRHDYTNRVQIKTATGVQWLTVPVQHGESLLKDTRIVEQGNWRRKHLRAIELAYQKAPYFERHFPSLKLHIAADLPRLDTLNALLLVYMLGALGVKTKIDFAHLHDFQGTKSDLVLDVCKQLGATKYIFGAKGRDYADVKSFNDAGIEVEFQDYHQEPYPQLHGGPFVPGLSAIDYLFNCVP